jgi:hypothetical protein
MSQPLQSGVASLMSHAPAVPHASAPAPSSMPAIPTTPANAAIDLVKGTVDNSYKYYNTQAHIVRGAPPKSVQSMVMYIVIAVVVMMLAIIYVVGSRKFEDGTKYSSVFNA